MKKKPLIQLLTACVFCGFILALSIMNIFAPKLSFSENENRVLADAPELSLGNIFGGSFDDQFETWFADHFTNRDTWIQMKATVRKDAGAIENNNVYLAKDGRLIQQFMSYDQRTVDNNIQYINEFAKDTGLTANVLLVPGAAYGERQFLPFGAYNTDEKKLIASIEEKFSDQNFINITDAISEGSDFYFKTDHHWNEKGAYEGYRAICDSVLHKKPEKFTYEKVSDSFRGTMFSKSGAFWTKADPIYRIDPEKKNHIKVTYEDDTTDDSLFVEENLDKKDKYTYYIDGNHAYEEIETSVNNGKTAVIVKDSYSHILIPYLAQEYSKIQVVDLRYYRQGVSTLIKDPRTTDFYVIYSTDTFCSDTNLAALW